MTGWLGIFTSVLEPLPESLRVNVHVVNYVAGRSAQRCTLTRGSRLGRSIITRWASVPALGTSVFYLATEDPNIRRRISTRRLLSDSQEDNLVPPRRRQALKKFLVGICQRSTATKRSAIALQVVVLWLLDRGTKQERPPPFTVRLSATGPMKNATDFTCQCPFRMLVAEHVGAVTGAALWEFGTVFKSSSNNRIEHLPTLTGP